MSNLKARLEKLEKRMDPDSNYGFSMATNGVLEDGRSISELTGNYFVMNLIEDTEIVIETPQVQYRMPVKDRYK